MVKIKKIVILIITAILAISALCCSCEKREPAAQPDPAALMAKLAAHFPECGDDNIKYESGNKTRELSYTKAAEVYSENKNSPADMSKIEKYCVVSNKNKDAEIGIFKLYDKANANYVKKMANTRISKMRAENISETNNNAEARSYGNYVYYVSHSEKDKIFEMIEDMLRGV